MPEIYFRCCLLFKHFYLYIFAETFREACYICCRRSNNLKFITGNARYFSNLEIYFKLFWTSNLYWCQHSQQTYMFSKSTIKTVEISPQYVQSLKPATLLKVRPLHWCRSGDFIVNFEHISVVFLLLTLNR